MKRLLLGSLLLASVYAQAQLVKPVAPSASPAAAQAPRDISALAAHLSTAVGPREATPGRSPLSDLRTIKGFVPQLGGGAVGTLAPAPLARSRRAVDPAAVNAYVGPVAAGWRTLPDAAAARAQLTRMALGDALGVDGDLVVGAPGTVDAADVRHLRLQQTYRGVAVYGGGVILHQPLIGEATATGRLQRAPEAVDVEPAFGPVEALDRAYATLGEPEAYPADSFAAAAMPAPTTPELFVHDDGTTFRLVYELTVNPDLAHRYQLLIDAHTGEEVRRVDQICRAHGHEEVDIDATRLEQHAAAFMPGPSTAQAQDLNGVTRTLQTYEAGGTFWMIDGTKPMFDQASEIPQKVTGALVTLDGQHTNPDGDGFKAVYATSDNNAWSDSRLVSAHYNTEQSFNYFRETFNRNSLDGQGGTVLAFSDVVQSDGSDMDNAFWNGRAMFYGNGDTRFRPLAGSLDVGGHEMSHGVIQNTANHEYKDESGALNEHFADVFAAMIDRENWQLGEDVVVQQYFPSGAHRDFENPANGGQGNGEGYQPPTYPERYVGEEDNGGVHINSGIGNNVCFRIAQAIGREKTEHLYYDVLSDYLNRNSQYIDYRNALQQKTEQQYGRGSAEWDAVVGALDAVGIPGGSGTGDGGGTGTPQDQPVNPGTQLVAYTDAAETFVRVVTLDGRTVIEDITPSYYPAGRATVTDDGSIALLVTQSGDINLIAIDYGTGTVTEELISGDSDQDGQGNVRGVSISREGTRLAILFDDYTPEIAVLDLGTGDFNFFELYTPSSDGDPLYTVDYADALEWDYLRENLIYDAYNTIVGIDGLEISNWDIGVLHAYDNRTQSLADGEISKLFGTLSEGTSIGNPTLAKNSEYILAFDLYEEPGTYQTLGVNLITSDIGLFWEGDRFGYPSFTASDDQLVFSAQTNDGTPAIGIVNVAESKIAATNDAASAVAVDGSRATAFANGQRRFVSAVTDLLGGAAWTVAPNPTADVVRVLRRADASLGEADFELFDTRGALLGRYPVGSTEIDLSGLPGGSYVLRQGERSVVVVRR